MVEQTPTSVEQTKFSLLYFVEQNQTMVVEQNHTIPVEQTNVTQCNIVGPSSKVCRRPVTLLWSFSIIEDFSIFIRRFSGPYGYLENFL